MEKNSKILVTGYLGLVGSAIVRALQKAGYTNLVLKGHADIDLTRQSDVEEMFEKERPEYVFSVAAKVGGIVANQTYPAEFIYINTMIAANIINSAYKTNVKKLLNLGSSCIYPRLAPQPMKEEYLLTGKLEETNEAYALAKIAAIKLCHHYNQQYGTNFISVMPTNQYGVNDHFNMETAHLLPMVMRRLHLAKLLSQNDFDNIKKDLKNSKLGWGMDETIDFEDNVAIETALNKVGAYRDKVLMWGDGSAYREMMSVDDTADACLYLMENKDWKDIGEFVNITKGDDIKLSDLYEIVKEIVGFKGNIEYDTSKPNGTPRKIMDATKLNSLGWSPKGTLKEGIFDFYEWYKK